MKYVSVLIFVLCSFLAFGQNNDNLLKKVTMPSPNAAELGKYGDVPIGLFTGAMEYTVPIFELKTQNLSLPISASYSSNGVKVDAYSSNIGINWALNCGGVITRSIRGRDDLLEGALLRPINGLSDGTIFSNPTDSLTAFLQNNVIRKSAEPDIYYYNFGSYSGKFVFDFDGQIYTIPHNTLKIQLLTNPTNSTYHSFLITTPDGVQYSFNKYELTSDIPYNCTDPYFTNFARETAWYITKIQHPYNDYINFTYTNVNYTDTPSISQSASRLDIGGWLGTTCATGTCGDMSLQYSNCYNTVSIQGCILSGVTTSNGSHIDFLNAARADIAGNQLHTGVRIYNAANNLVRSINFNYTNTSNGQRFFLTKLDFLNSDNTINNSYGFEYQNYSLLPNRLSYAQDKYGYSNGATSNNLFVIDDMNLLTSSYTSNRESNGTYSTYGMLSKITYPTGGSTAIDYESHKSTGLATVLLNHDGGFGLATPGAGPGLYDQNTLQHSFTVPANAVPTDLNLEVDAVYRNSGLKDTYNRRVIYQLIDLTTNSDVQGVPPNFQGIGASPIDNSILSYTATNNTTNSVLWVAHLVPGHSYNMILTVESANLYGYATVSYSYTDTTTTQQLLTTDYGGARVKRMTNIPNIGVPTVKNFFYNNIDAITNTPLATSGQLTMGFSTGSQIINRTLCGGDGLGGGECICCFYECLRNQESSSLMQVNLGGNHVYYSSVIESIGDNFANGGTEHTYMVSTDEPGSAIYMSPFVNNHRIINVPVSNTGYKNGTETRTRVFKKKTDGTFQVILQEDKEYTESTYNKKDITSYSVIQHNGPICEGTPAQFLTLYSVVSYRTLSRWFYQSAAVKTETDDNGNTLVTREDYSYDNPNHCFLTKTTTTDSKNQTVVSQTSYPQDLVLAGPQETARQDLVNKFMLAAKLDEVVAKNAVQTSEKKTNYKIFPNGLTLPESIELKISSNPSEKRVEFLSYDGFGNITQQHKLNDVLHSYIWDYSNTFPVAEIVNAGITSVAYTSFETTSNGNWTVGTGTQGTTGGITGSNFYTLASGATISTAGLDASRKYLVTYWSKNGPLTISGTTATSGLVKNGWTYYQHTLPAGSSSVSVTGSGIILDELRLYPADALMTTSTYTPLVGITSICTPNNLTTYYEYDGFNRLLRIRDIDGNIIKQYDYQYQAAQ